MGVILSGWWVFGWVMQRSLVNIYNLVVTGGLVGLALALFIFLGNNVVQETPIKVLLIASGLLGGYGFWYGINK
jgi:hypothetical protein